MRLCLSVLVSLIVPSLLTPLCVGAEPIAARYKEGCIHGYLALRTLDGKIIAAGDLIQTVHGSQVTSRLVYRFHDGSIDDDTAVFTQNGTSGSSAITTSSGGRGFRSRRMS